MVSYFIFVTDEFLTSFRSSNLLPQGFTVVREFPRDAVNSSTKMEVTDAGADPALQGKDVDLMMSMDSQGNVLVWSKTPRIA